MSVGEVWHALGQALALAGSMTWEILWALVLGFGLSAIVQAVVSKEAVARLLGDDRPGAIATATGFGIASSSCSYAAVALARSLFRKGASFTAALAFEIASTNLVVELGLILALLLGWQFTAAEFVGGPVMIVLLVVAFRVLLGRRSVHAARQRADRGTAGSMEGHATMDMSVPAGGSFWQRLVSPAGVTSVAHVFVMEWAAIWKDLVGGLLIAGALGAWVPEQVWHTLFVTGNPTVSAATGPVLGPVVAVVSFVCSIGNVPLAVVLWMGGLSFGGVIAFLYADLIILPILNIYRKYYGLRMAAFLAGALFATAAVTGYVVELIFTPLGLVPDRASARMPVEGISWNYTSWLNIAALIVSAWLVVRFVHTGGMPMLRTMGGAPDSGPDHHGHGSA